MTLQTAVTELKGVGEALAAKLAGLGIVTLGQLIENYPRKYEDYSRVVQIKDIRPGAVTLAVTISQVAGRYVRRGMHITEALAGDTTGTVRLVWFNQPYRAAALRPGTAYYVAGEYALRRGRFAILNPSVERVGDFPVNTARIIPVYREAKGLKSFTIRRLIREALQSLGELPEHLPAWVVKRQNLIDYSAAVTRMHSPGSLNDLKAAQKRLGFEEVFQLTLAALLNKYELYQNKALAIPFREELAKRFVSELPFRLTDDQRRVVWRVYQDIGETQPMNRLVEGDVGSGKTVVAAMAALMALEQDFQVALMAPTEILARQHATTLKELLAPLGYHHRVGLLSGSLKPNVKKSVRQRAASGRLRFIVGTHALISEKFDMRRLGLVIIDEQHRFGVDQRKKLQAKAGHMPHVLHMSATPIPRSLALTLYGELDISQLRQLPPGRRPVKTILWPPGSRAGLYAAVQEQLSRGRQLFVVCPSISQNEKSARVAVETVFERLKKQDLKRYRIGLLHGRLKDADKEEVMQRFVSHQLDALVSTTVIEVGVDVPNASVMIIEGAEFFGLAQLHQLRGRVGRGSHQSYCYLVPSSTQAPLSRLRALETLNDGFELAELDLRLRGPGAIYGTLQHGALDLRVARLDDMRLITAARNAAQQFIERGENLLQYDHLAARVQSLRAVTNLQ